MRSHKMRRQEAGETLERREKRRDGKERLKRDVEMKFGK